MQGATRKDYLFILPIVMRISYSHFLFANLFQKQWRNAIYRSLIVRKSRELKRQLATRISPALVYERKLGFRDNAPRYTSDPEIADLIDDAILTCDRDLGIHLDCGRIP